ncbi:hypothetical protein JVU11DRAFT_10542 [Chiua virens]|nr:hypothetical protein JVU11DRAFT_10542 [Chiua virens]
MTTLVIAEVLPQGLTPQRYSLRSWQGSWAVRHFYGHEHRGFASHEKHWEFFLWLVECFDEKWPMRPTIFPHLPLDVTLDDTQLQELEKKKLDLYFNFGLDFDIQVIEPSEE